MNSSWCDLFVAELSIQVESSLSTVYTVAGSYEVLCFILRQQKQHKMNKTHHYCNQELITLVVTIEHSEVTI